MKIKLTDCTIDTTKIKKLRDRPIKLLRGLNKKIRPHYSIEFIDDTFKVITKQEYKILKDALDSEGDE